MPELDDAAFERRLRGVLKERLDALPLDLTVDALDRRREASGLARRSARGRGITLLAAAALLLVGGALAAGSGLLRLPTVVPPVPEPSVMAVATASPDAASPDPSESAAPSASPIRVAGPGGVWIQTGSMVTPLAMVTPLGGPAVRLLDGRVLVVGDAGDDLTSAELYDPATGTWSATGKMVKWADAEGLHATLLADGKVLVTGPNSAQLYDPASGTWTATGKMIGNFTFNAFTVLRDGRVLAVSGADSPQLYDPASGNWTTTGKMNIPRLYGAVATLLSDGKVLVAGGFVHGELTAGLPPLTDAAEVYDPVTGSWTEIADMQGPHAVGMATQLTDGKVLVYSRMGAEVYDPTTGTWTAFAKPTEFLPDPRALLSDGTVLTDAIDDQAGANDPAACPGAVFDPRTGSLTPASSTLRCGNSFTLLLDGTVLVAGGSTCNDEGVCVSTGAAELYVPAGVQLPPLPAFPSPPPVVFPDPTPTPTPAPLLPPAVGPTPPNALSWKLTVDNRTSEPATLFVATDDGTLRLVGSATPNVVPAGTTMKVTFRFPAHGGWIFVNPRPGGGDGGGLVNEDQIGIPGNIRITAECGCWVGPAQ